MPKRKNQTSIKKGQVLNPTGRPKKGMTLTETMQEFLRKIPKGQEKTNKELFVERIYLMAERGDASCIRLIWNYIEGMPTQKVETEISLKQYNWADYGENNDLPSKKVDKGSTRE